MKEKENIEQAVFKVLQYFDLFKFPLSREEIRRYMGVKCSVEELNKVLTILIKEQRLYEINGCVLLREDSALVKRKHAGKTKSEKEMKRAKIVASIIYAFPFVRMVSVSGSLSKGYADERSDIDFFIVTETESLWVCRTVLHMLKKLTFLFNLQHSFCMNYFIADKHLEIQEKNYFTAIELSTLIPLKGESYYAQLIQSNAWFKEFLPNYEFGFLLSVRSKTSFLKKMVESILNSSKLNSFLMNLTLTKWKKKWMRKGMSAQDFELAFKTNLYVSKNHPANNQKVILEKYQGKAHEA